MNNKFEIHRRGEIKPDEIDDDSSSATDSTEEDEQYNGNLTISNDEIIDENNNINTNQEEEDDDEEHEEERNERYDLILESLSKISYICVHIIILIMFLINLFFSTPQYSIIYYLPRSYENSMQIFYGYFFFSTAYFLIKTKTTAKGTINPKHYSENEEGYCDICDVPKYKRVHHCSTCKECIVRMDHHCSFINTCIGLHNLRYFYAFLLYATFLCLFQLSQTIILTYHHNKIPSSKTTLLIIALLLSIGCTMGIVFLFIAQTLLITCNMTLLEFYKLLNSTSMSLEQHEYYKSIKENWCEAFMITSLWKLPFKFIPFISELL